MQKTGTTFMQKSIFPELTDVHVVRGFNKVIDLIRGKHTAFSKVLITDENISGRMRGGSYYADFARNIEAIKLIFHENPKIIIGFRAHEAFLHSAYKYMLRSGLSKDVNHIFNIQNTGVLRFEDLYYQRRIELLKKNFTDVFVYTNESMRLDLPRFLGALQTFLGEENSFDPRLIQQKKDQNVGFSSEFEVSALRKVNQFNDGLSKITGTPGLYNRFFKRFKMTPGLVFQNNMPAIFSKKHKLPEELVAFVREHFAADWEETLKHVSY